MNPISSRLGSDHTVETDAAFSFVVLTVVAVVAFLPHGPFLFVLLRGLFVLAAAVGGDFPQRSRDLETHQCL